MKFILIITTIFLFINSTISFSQQSTSPKKVGLCLSGGGAKGLAHIGLLKRIDSLNIKIDYITGTSMGSVVGGLYASGWSGKQIDSLSRTLDWAVLLNQFVPMNEISIDEKDEYQNYIGEIPIQYGKVQVTGFIEGQNLQNVLNKLTRHVNHISDFDHLPIPFRCLAVDIKTVKPVVLKSGNLANSLRSSMAIPTIFKPVKIDSFLLVDGGLMDNFPVDELKKMGADFVIGSYTGSRLLEEHELNTVTKLLMQSSSFYAINESKEGIKNCDIFNNLTANMKHISAGMFHKYDQILKIGDRVSYHVLPELVKLSNTQKQENISFIKQPLKVEESPILISKIIIDTISHSNQKKFISNKLTIQPGDVVHHKDLERAVTKIYSNRNLLKAYYSIQPTDSAGNVIKFKVLEDAKFRFKGALHFDSELGAGFILNFTMRNVVGKNSRLLATVDLAQSPRYRIHYRKYLWNTPLSFNVQLYREKVAFNSYNQQGRGEDVFMNLYRSFDMGLNYALGVNTSLYAGYQANINKYSPKFSNSNQDFVIKSYEETYEGSVFQFKYNTVDRRFFSRKGIDFRVEDRYSFYTVQELKAQAKDIFTDSISEIALKNYTNPFNSLNVKLNVFLPLSKKLTVSLKMNTGLIAENVVKEKVNPRDSSYTLTNISEFQQFRIGGVDSRFRDNYIPFFGVKEGEFFANSFSSSQIALQYEVKSNLFLTPFFSYCYSASSFKNYLANYKNISLKNESLNKNPNYTTIYTYGLNLGYKTPLGPLTLSVSKPSIVGTLRYYLSFGYTF